MSKAIVDFDFNRINKNVEAGKYSIYISVCFENITMSYSIGVYLTNAGYDPLQNAFLTTKKTKVIILQIKTACERIKAIANLLIPFNPMAFSYIMHNAKREYPDIFINLDDSFDALKIVSKWLDDYELMTYVPSSKSLYNCFATKVPASEEENELINSMVIKIHSLLDDLTNPQATLCLLKAIELL